MKPTRVKISTVKKAVKDLQKGSDRAIGNYLYKNFRVQVSKYKLPTSKRVSFLYHKRRSQGLCIRCSKKVRDKNPRTGKLYRLCSYHRKQIDRK